MIAQTITQNFPTPGKMHQSWPANSRPTMQEKTNKRTRLNLTLENTQHSSATRLTSYRALDIELANPPSEDTALSPHDLASSLRMDVILKLVLLTFVIMNMLFFQ
ncbi:hypothetical protein V6N13_099873 [Hibiscus sabdariffa]